MSQLFKLFALVAFVFGIASPVLAQYPTANIGGTWYFRGLPASIHQDGYQLLLRNERGSSSRGAVTSPTTIVAYDWGNLRGRVTPQGQEIVWPDGATWTRYPQGGGGGPREPVRFDQGVCNTWSGCAVYDYGNSLVFVNEQGQRASGYVAGQNRVYVNDWRLGGTLVYQGYYLTRIEWDNGSWWGR